MSFKACFGEDIRRFALPSPTFASLQEKISSLFAVRNPRITWRDVDGDVVTLATDDDLREALRTLSGEPNAALRVVVTESLDSATSVPVFPPTPTASAPTTVRVSAAAAAAVAAAREAAIPVVRETSRAASVSGSAAAPTLTERVERMDIDDHAEPTPAAAATADPAGSDPRDIPESPFAAEHAYDPEAAVAPIAAFVRSVLSGLANAGIEVEVVDDENAGGAAAGPCGSADRCFGGACGTEPTGDSASSSTSAGASASASGTADEDVVHPGVVCDVCEGSIVGRRFKCTICPDFDLCMRCEATGAHADHPMVRLCRPGLRTRGHHPFGHGHFFGRRGGCSRRAWAHGCGPAGSAPEETPRGAAPTETAGEPGVSHPGHPHSHPHGAGHWHGARHGGHRGFQFGPFGFAFPPFPGSAPAAHPGAHAHPHAHPHSHPHGGPHGHPHPHSFPFGGFGRCGRGGFPWGGPDATAEVPRTQPAPTSTPTPPTPPPAPASAAAHAGAAPTSSRAPSSPISDAAQLLREMGFEVDDASLRTVMQQFGGDIDSVIAHLCAN